MTKMVRYSALLASAAMLIAAPAMAQVRDLDRESSDVRVFQGSVDNAPAVFTVTVPARSVMVIDVLASGDLDPVLRVTDARTGELIGEDDDGGEGLNSRLRVMGERGRRVRIEVNSYNAEWASDGESYGGSFDLRLATSAYVAPRAVTYGARETGRINGDERLYTIQGVAGELVEIALIGSDGLDPMLELRNPGGSSVAFNDDSNGLNSMIRYTFEESGTYTIAAQAFGSSSGSYVLRVRDRQVPGAPTMGTQVIGIGQEVSGEVASAWGDGAGWEEGGEVDGAHVDYRLSDAAIAAIRGGEGAVTVHLNAGDAGDPDFGGTLDPLVELGFETPLGFASVAQDDDGGGNLNSLLPIDLSGLADSPEMLSALRIRAAGFGGSSGGYTLSITPGLEERVEYDWAAEAAEAAADAVEEESY
ncbi:MAG: PPC domain-containing protein [Erythrobacter sp.]|nr:PPC domain-containing protein [Erythrobacter sp.]